MLPLRRPVILVFAFACMTLLASAASSGPTAAFAATTCDRFASTSGSDAAAGTSASPFRTAQKLISSLSPGQTGCLQPGTYSEDVTVRTGGSSGSPITLTSSSGQAVLRGRLWITDTANDVTVQGLALDGRNSRNLPSPSVEGNRVRFLGNDVTNYDTTICFNLGSHQYGRAADVVVEGNRIHNCGARPATNHHHGIFMVAADRTIVRGNYIYANADRGVQVWPDSHGSRIENNVIDGNGTGLLLGGDGVYASSDNVAAQNIITFSRQRYGVEWVWGDNNTPVGVRNLVELNCLYANQMGDLYPTSLGYTVQNNLVADPLFVNREAGDFALRSGSPCVGKGPQTAAPQPSGGGSTSPPAPPTSPPTQPAPTPPSATPPVNSGAPVISGQLKRRGKLAVSSGSWTGTTPITFSFQWLRCDTAGSGCSPIAGASSATYVVADADVGRTLRASVTATNQAGSAAVVSAATGVVPRNGSGGFREPSASGSTAGTASTSSAKLGPMVALLRPRALSSRRLLLRARATPGATVNFVVRGLRGRILGTARAKADPAGRVNRTVTIATLGSRRYLKISASVRAADGLRRAKLAVRLTPRRARGRAGA